ncbi:MAG: NADH-quinone oxidoreductase subunit M [Ignavibacterium sp.]|nr:NADH-quinone oxidoreductase subunit M [Ignavibacterium sp.]
MNYHFLGIGYLTWITFLPLIGMIVVMLIPKGNTNTVKWTALITTLLQLFIAALIWINFDPTLTGINNPNGFQYVEKFRWIDIEGFTWIGNVAIDYFVGLDGLSLPMVMLTAIISFIGVIASWNIKESLKGYFALYLMLVTGMMGVFVALDFFLFYIFWELTLLPMYFLIGIWGGPRREYAAIKFFIYTLLGSVLILLVIIGLYSSVMVVDPISGQNIHSFNMLDMMNPKNYIPDSLLSGIGTYWRSIAFIALFIGFAIKVPVFPFHTWLPDAHVEAPTAISVILAGVLLKLGGYGLLRISYSIFPDAMLKFAYPMAILGLINIIYGAFCAMAQKDFKKMIAYSSISHMGVVLLGISALNIQGITGGVLQMFNHGIVTAMLFLIVGVIYDRTHTRNMDDFGGMAKQMPIYTGITTVAFFAAIGLPGLNEFVSELLSYLGAFQTFFWIAILSTIGIVLTAAYMLGGFQKIFFGKLPVKWQSLPDINRRELVMLIPLMALVILLGILPTILIHPINATLNHFVDFVQKVGTGLAATLF